MKGDGAGTRAFGKGTGIGPADWRISWDTWLLQRRSEVKHMPRCWASLRCGMATPYTWKTSWLGWGPRRKSTDFRALNDTLRSAAQDERAESAWSGQQGDVLDSWHAGWNNYVSSAKSSQSSSNGRDVSLCSRIETAEGPAQSLGELQMKRCCC